MILAMRIGNGQRALDRDLRISDTSPYCGCMEDYRNRRLIGTMKICLEFLLAVGLAISALSAMAACPPLPGAEQVWSKPSVRWVLVGETHGSNETPAAFLDLVCNALARGKRVTVALELPIGEQGSLDGILTGNNLQAAKESLFSQDIWRQVLDGRGSEAMLRLLLGLRDLRRSYPDLSVAAFDAPYTRAAGGAGPRDKALGTTLLALGTARPMDTILILTGNYHAMQAPMHGYRLAAMYLPPKERLSLEVTDRGGETWSDLNAGGCGVWKSGVGDKGIPNPRGIYLDPSLAPYGKVDGILSLGTALTASAPAAGEPSPLPDCRIRYIAEHHLPKTSGR